MGQNDANVYPIPSFGMLKSKEVSYNVMVKQQMPNPGKIQPV